MPINIEKVYDITDKTHGNSLLMAQFKGILDNQEIQDLIGEDINAAIQNNKTNYKLVVAYVPAGDGSGELLLFHGQKDFIAIRTTSRLLNRACDKDFMKFATIVTDLLDESKIAYTVNEVSKIGDTGMGPRIEMQLKIK